MSLRVQLHQPNKVEVSYFQFEGPKACIELISPAGAISIYLDASEHLIPHIEAAVSALNATLRAERVGRA
jgi:hypothetical protein